MILDITRIILEYLDHHTSSLIKKTKCPICHNNYLNPRVIAYPEYHHLCIKEQETVCLSSMQRKANIYVDETAFYSFLSYFHNNQFTFMSGSQLHSKHKPNCRNLIITDVDKLQEEELVKLILLEEDRIIIHTCTSNWEHNDYLVIGDYICDLKNKKKYWFRNGLFNYK